MTELVTLLTTYYPQLISIVLIAGVIGYVIGQLYSIVDLQIKVLNREEVKRKLKQNKFEEKRKAYQKAFDECGFTPGEHGLYGETYDILNNLNNLRNAIIDFDVNKCFDAEKHWNVYYWTDMHKEKTYKFIFYKRFKKWKDCFIIDKSVIKEIKELEKVINEQKIKIRKTEEKRESFCIHPSLTIEYIDFIKNKDKIITIIDRLETKLKKIKINYNLDTHGTIPK